MTINQSASREAFERIITASPYEQDIDRFSEHATWPGNYKSYQVQLAWCLFEEAIRMMCSRPAPAETEQPPVSSVASVEAVALVEYNWYEDEQEQGWKPCTPEMKVDVERLIADGRPYKLRTVFTYPPDATAEIASLNARIADLQQLEPGIEKLKGECERLRAELEAVRNDTARHPTISECETSGKGPAYMPGVGYSEGGLPNTPEERARFEAYMRGHCWAAGSYDSTTGAYDTRFVRCCYGVWRDRGSLPTIYAALAVQTGDQKGGE